MTSRIQVLAVVALTLVLAPVQLWAAGAARSEQHPNIVLIIADDLGWRDVGFHGSEIRTPTLDSIAARGVELSRYYTYPVCSTTRAALLAGQSALALGVDGPIADEHVLPAQALLLPEVLRNRGYQTLMVGKWHLGARHARDLPNARGFDYFYGHLGGYVDYFSHLRDGGLDWQRNGRSVDEPGYTTHLLGADAARLIKARDRSRPFFLYVAFNAPHTPLQVPDAYLKGYEAIPDTGRRIFAGMVTAMDEAIGKVMTAVRDEGIVENTIVVFVSDNGGNERAGADNGPLHGGKGEIFDGGLRVPALLSWPGHLKHPGRKVSQQVAVYDLFPTLLAAAGIDASHSAAVIGRNLWPAIANGESVDASRDVVLGIGRSTTIFSGPWKLLNIVPRNKSAESTLLYRIDDDPAETEDVAARHPDVVAELMTRVARVPRGPSLTSTTSRPPEERWTTNGVMDYSYRETAITRAPWAESLSKE